MVLVMLLATAPQPTLGRIKLSETNDDIAIEIIQTLEVVKAKMELLRSGSVNTAGTGGNGWDARQLSIAITELEGSQLRLANARPE
jgi:hypothetical protein